MPQSFPLKIARANSDSLTLSLPSLVIENILSMALTSRPTGNDTFFEQCLSCQPFMATLWIVVPANRTVNSL
jgi:hypothetical protein